LSLFQALLPFGIISYIAPDIGGVDQFLMDLSSEIIKADDLLSKKLGRQPSGTAQ